MSAARQNWAPYAVVLTIGFLFAGGAAIGADRQPLIWAIPPLVLTTVVLGFVALADHRREDRAIEATATELGLRDTGVHPLPPLTPVLARTAPPHMLVGELADGMPCRLARAGRRLVVCITAAPVGLDAEAAERPRVVDHDALPPAIPASRPLAADPHGLLGAETTADPAVAEWIAERRLGLVVHDGTLVVAAEAGTPFEALLAATAEARARLS